MKRMGCFITLLLLCCWLLPAVALAEVKAGVFTVSPMLGGIRMEGNQAVEKDSPAYSLGIGYNLTEHFGLETVLAGSSLDKKGSGGSTSLVTYRLDGLYRFLPQNRLVPYLAAGVGGYNLSSNHELMANYGGGLLYYFANNVAFRADARHLMAIEGKTQHNLLYTAGFLFQLAGATPPPVAAAPPDSDGDGEPDHLDRCPGTPAGVAVDRHGCPIDSDGDGVPDYLDACPDTPAGVAVDGRGCPIDSDGDGVPDYLDQCPDTPLGVPVDETGCPLTLTLYINFAFDSDVIGAEYRSELDKAAAFVRANEDVPFIVISGHTDSRGSAAYNLRLSERRAAAVRQALIDDYGLDRAKLIARGYGETQPIADNDTEEGRYQNRRVQLMCCVVLPE